MVCFIGEPESQSHCPHHGITSQTIATYHAQTVYRGKRVYQFSGQVIYGNLLAGLVGAKSVVSPTGFEPVLQA